MHALYLLSVCVHIVAAATWVGGSILLAVAVVPTALWPEFRDRGVAFVHQVALRFLWIEWICFAILIATGFFNLFVQGGSSWEILGRDEFWTSSYGRVLAGKLAVVCVILALSWVHDFVLGPLAARVCADDRGSLGAGRLRLAVRWAGRVNLLLALVAIGLAVTLVRGWPW